ncbi:juvenile hormone esterase-like [Leptidea sinapis]|uniref:juvenile hormone esterase-like n=1 Tax=Leptidea sinapis TaxID=189913 RepID=UPI0021285DAA|nr:juvenile hormone esterase-like [Leptidea sinapis]
MNIVRYTVVLMCGSVCGFNVPTPVVRLSQGPVQGLRSLSGQNRYYNIPYAVAGRFQKPQDPPKWNNLYKATNHTLLIKCPQWLVYLTFGTEDCLYLDVYVPETAEPRVKLPVMIFFHGGSYYTGAKDLYDPEFLVLKNAIVVTANYRLGVLGFLCLGGISNLGLRDQVMALKWVQNNIAAFGGDPDNVTICGQSAGASSASMHLLSELSRGLFHKVILLSGSAFSVWAFNTEPQRPAFEDANKISTAYDVEDVLNVFRNASLDNLIKATTDVSTNPRYFKYSPCIDVDSMEPFFLDMPYNLVTSGRFNKVPVMMGYTDLEGSYFYSLLYPDTVAKLNDNLDEMLPSLFSWCSRKDKTLISRKIREHYFGDEKVTLDSVQNLIKFYSDWVAYATSSATSALLTKYSEQPVYNYQFSYEGGREYAKFTTVPHIQGTTHSGELFYVFKPQGISLPLSGRDANFIDRLTTMIKNFMLYSDPTPRGRGTLSVRWPRATSAASNTLVLTDTPRVLATPAPHHAGQFFYELLCAYGWPGYVPCESRRMCNRE